MSRYVKYHKDCKKCRAITHYDYFTSCYLCHSTSEYCDECIYDKKNFVYELEPKKIGDNRKRHYFCLGCLERHHHTKKEDIEVFNYDNCKKHHGGTLAFYYEDRLGCLCCIQKDKSEYDYWIELINRQYQKKKAIPFKQELLNYNYKKYFTFYVTPNKKLNMDKKWTYFKTKKVILLIRDLAGGYSCLGIGSYLNI
jgi:hypothetical protein